ncbi:MAG: hypothetical protein MUF87_01265 [Anaerolineae bacterium]|jgi:hypothetical protein|nr:hypothetical protein [Anaerolineae bacterium]
MPAWVKITRPNIEVGAQFTLFQALIVDLERATGFAIQNQGSVGFIIDGKVYTVQQQLDPKAYQGILDYCQKITGKTLT